MEYRHVKRTLTSESPSVTHALEAPDLYTGEPPLQSAHNVWSIVQRDLSYALGANVHRSWTGRLSVRDACERTITLSAPSRFIASKIESQYADTLRRLWAKHDVVLPPRDVLVSTMDRSPTRRAPASVAAKLAPEAPSAGTTASPTLSAAERARERFSFDNFVVGASNELAFAVAKKVATSHSPAYNPVVIHAANGMGKTHLLYAVKHHIEAHEPERRVHIISSEQFVNSFVAAFRKSKGRDGIESFKASLRDVDMLIIDDAHFIADKPGSQEELLHTLVSLVDAGRQILIASDRHPDQIEKASPRLRSYLSSGLCVKISPADYELRLRILDHLIARKRAHAAQTGGLVVNIPKNARDHLAARINATPRDLEGAFNQVIAQAEFLGTPITLETIQEALSDSRYATAQRLTVDRIQRAVCEMFELTMTDMTSKRRARAVARPRQVAMYLSKTLTKRSLPDIGRRFGGRDHTTVMHAVKRIQELCAEDPQLKSQVNELRTTLTGG
jgi:chromosomal replication initiator protein